MKKYFQEFKIELLSRFQKTPKYCATILHIFVLLVGLGIVLFLVTLWIAPHASKLYHHVFTISLTERKEINIEDKRHIEYLLLKNKIIPISEVYNHTLEYYNSLISILIALLGVFAFRIVDIKPFQKWLKSYLFYPQAVRTDIDFDPNLVKCN